MRRNILGFAATSLAAVGALALTGATIATAADDSNATPTPSVSASASPGDRAGGPRSEFQDTAVTGTEADKVIAAVKAKDTSATIDTVRKDPDGSYDALGTKDGNPVLYDVSTDLKTITENTGHPGGKGRHDGPCVGSQGSSVTGTEADKVIAAVKAKDTSATIDTVRKDPDGSYDALGTRDGNPVLFHVSTDLKTITEKVRGHGAPGGTSSSGTPSTDPSATNASNTSPAI
ncbi:MAG: hypothetical protein ABIU87_03200 [Ornithinibacter sp.]